MIARTFRLSENDIELLKSFAQEHELTQVEAIRKAIQLLEKEIHVETAESTAESGVDAMAALVAQLAVKDRQIERLGKALEGAQETAKAAQALHAAGVQQAALESGEQTARRRWRWPWDKHDNDRRKDVQ